MSETVTLPEASLIESANVAAPALSPPSSPIGNAAEQVSTSAPVLALPSALPPEMQAMLELIGCGLAPEADDRTRSVARELWARFAQTIAAAAPVMPSPPMNSGPVMPPAPTMPGMPVMPTVPAPTSPIAMAARTLHQLPPEQLLDLALQRLRAALPAGTTVSAPKGIQFQLVPVTPPGLR